MKLQTQHNPKHSVILARVSSKEQEETGYSLPAQEKMLKDYAERKQMNVKKVFSIAESASGSKQREQFYAMLEYVKKHKINCILVEKVDRLTRNMRDALVVNEWIQENPSHQVHFVKNNLVVDQNTRSDDTFKWDIEVILAKKYTANLSEEVKKGQEEKIQQGGYPSRPPLGYKTVGEKGRKMHVINHDIAPLIRKTFELYSSGNYSVKELVKVMKREGLRNESGSEVKKTTMHRLLTNPFYYGQFNWNDKLWDGNHEPIITKELFDQVKSKLERKTSSPTYRKHNPVFKAVFHCGECGSVISWETHKGHWYGCCKHYKPCSQKGSLREEDVEKQLMPHFDTIAPKNERVVKWLEKALKSDQADVVETHNAKKKEMNAQIERLDRRLDAMYMDKIDQKIDLDYYEKKKQEFDEERSAIKSELARLDDSKAEYYAVGIAIHELALKAWKIYNSEKATIEEKRLLLSYVFSNSTIKERKLAINYTFAFDFLQNWMPAVNKTFEPAKLGLTKTKNTSEKEMCSVWLGDRDSNPDSQDQNLESYH